MSTQFHASETEGYGSLAPRRSDTYKWWVLATAIFGAFVSILDTTIVNTALPHIQRAFGADLHVASYITTAYTLAQGVVIAASGFLATRFGIKRVYLLSLALFTLGSALCGLAWNIDILVLFRVLQGASGAALFPPTSTTALTGIGGTALPGANTLLGVSRSVVSSLAVVGFVNLVHAQRFVHQAALAHTGSVTVAITRQAQALAYQDVFLLSALVTLPLLLLALFLRVPRHTQGPEATTPVSVSTQTPEAVIGTS